MNQPPGIALSATICSAILLILSAVTFAEDDCGNAVDAADSMNVNQQGCDYSDEGLNGFLQKAFKKGDEGAVLNRSRSETGAEKQFKKDAIAADEIPSVAQNPAKLNNTAVLSVVVDQWAKVPLAKNQLLPKIMEQCNSGFQVLSEIYRPQAMGRIELSVEYSCL